MAKSKIAVFLNTTVLLDQSFGPVFNFIEKFGCDALLIHIHKNINLQYTSIFSPAFKKKADELQENMEKELKEGIDHFVEMNSSENLNVESYQIPIDHIKECEKIISKNRIKMIIIPFMKEDLEGNWPISEIETLIRILPIPILIIKNKRCFSPKSIMWPFAFQGLSSNALDMAEIFCNIFDSKITPIHVYHPRFSSKPSLEFDDLGDYLHNEQEIITYQVIKKKIHEFLNHRKYIDGMIIRKRKEGDKEDLLKEIADMDPDLIIMGSSGKKGLKRLYLGSFCEYLLRNSQASILITKKF